MAHIHLYSCSEITLKIFLSFQFNADADPGILGGSGSCVGSGSYEGLDPNPDRTSNQDQQNKNIFLFSFTLRKIKKGRNISNGLMFSYFFFIWYWTRKKGCLNFIRLVPHLIFLGVLLTFFFQFIPEWGPSPFVFSLRAESKSGFLSIRIRNSAIMNQNYPKKD